MSIISKSLQKIGFNFRSFKNFQFIIVSLLVIMSFYSCIPSSKAVFFPDIREKEKFIDSSLFENSKRVFSGDRIQLRIVTKDEEANEILNAALKGYQTTTVVNTNEGDVGGYLIDPDGFIEIPTLGKISVRGKTPTEIKELVKNIISDFYKDVEVYCTIGGRVMLFNGAGGNAATSSIGIPIINERLTIVEVLNGISPTVNKIDKIWLIRETDGIRHFIKINMNTVDIFDSPYYYLRNNDIIYLEPYSINSFLAINNPLRNLLTFVITIPTLIIGIRSFFVK